MMEVIPEVTIPRGVSSVDTMWKTLKEDRSEPEEWETITGRENVQLLMIQWCRKHFNQAAETPLAGSKWERRLNIGDKGNIVSQMLEKGADGLDIDVQVCVDWINGLQKKRLRRRLWT